MPRLRLSSASTLRIGAFCLLLVSILEPLRRCSVSAEANINVEYDNGRHRFLGCELTPQDPAIGPAVVTCAGSDGGASTDYRWVVFSWCFPSLVVAAAAVICVILYFTCHCCCCCCCCGGGRSCGGANKEEEEEDAELRRGLFTTAQAVAEAAKYTRTDIHRVHELVLLALALAIAGAVWSIVEASRLQHTLSNSADAVATAADGSSSIRHQIQSLSHVTFYNATLRRDAVLDATTTAFNDTNVSLSTLADAAVTELGRAQNGSTVEWWHVIRRFVPVQYLLSALLVVGVFVLWTVSGCHCTGRGTGIVMVLFFTLLVVLLWCAQGGAQAAHFVLRESCRELDAFATQHESILGGSSAVVPCNDTAVRLYQERQIETLSSLVLSSYRSLEPFCFDPLRSTSFNINANQILDCSSMPSSSVSQGAAGSSSSSAESVEFVANWTLWATTRPLTLHPAIAASASLAQQVQDGGYFCSSLEDACSLEACSAHCVNAVTQRPTNFAYLCREIDSLARYLLDFTLDAYYVTSTSVSLPLSTSSPCEQSRQAIYLPMAAHCPDAVLASFQLLRSNGIMGLSAILGLIACMYGRKRFIPYAHTLIPQAG